MFIGSFWGQESKWEEGGGGKKELFYPLHNEAFEYIFISYTYRQVYCRKEDNLLLKLFSTIAGPQDHEKGLFYAACFQKIPYWLEWNSRVLLFKMVGFNWNWGSNGDEVLWIRRLYGNKMIFFVIGLKGPIINFEYCSAKFPKWVRS